MTALPVPVVDWDCVRCGDHGNRQPGIGGGNRLGEKAEGPVGDCPFGAWDIDAIGRY